MNINILRRKNLIAIYVVYNDGQKKQVKVNIHFLDKDICYLETDLWDNNFKKPKSNQNAELLVYTVNGIYTGKTKIIDTTLSLQKVMFSLSTPSKWTLTQARTSIRKVISLPFIIKYEDGYEIKGETIDISSGGISFALTEPILPMYYKFNAKINIDISSTKLKNSENNDIKSTVKYLRKISSDKATTYVYRFITMDSFSTNILKLLLNT